MTHFPVILSSPSGAGKTTIARRLLELRPDTGYSISCTTRPRRSDEEDGRDYYFLTSTEFLERQQRGEFAELATVHGHLYGTLRSEVERALSDGKHVIMDIDVQGAEQFRRVFPQSVLVFVLPPSASAMLQRLQSRGSETPKTLARRLTSALVELRSVQSYQYVVVNDDLDRAVANVSAIIDAEGMRRERLGNLEHDLRAMIEHLERELVENSTED